MIPKVSDIYKFFEKEFADIRKQSEWDFSGAQVLTSDRQVRKIALSLDPTEECIDRSINMGCELLITHHPLFFHPQRGLNFSKSIDRRAIKAIKGGLDILSYHTNIDICDNGTSDYIVNLLGAEPETGFLTKEGSIARYKLSVFVPYDYKDTVFDALKSAGAGKGVKYSGCAFISEGAGLFTPLSGSRPFIGQEGEQELVDEVKIEMIVDEADLSAVKSAISSSHPYEEPAFDIIKLANGADFGFGRIALTDKEYRLPEFITLIKERLGIKNIRTNMQDCGSFNRVALSTGSGGSLWKDCIKKGVKVIVTGDMKYHDALDAADAGICIIDAGHEATEDIYMRYLSEILKNKFDVETFIEERKNQILSWG